MESPPTMRVALNKRPGSVPFTMSAWNPDSILVQMMESGEFSDLKFVCNGEKFNVHKAVVCGQSPVVKAAIQGGFEESQTNVITMDNFQPSTVKRLVQFMYTGDYQDPQYEHEAPLADQNRCLGDISDATKEAGLVGDLLQLRASEESSTENPLNMPGALSLQNSPAAAALFEHIRVNSIGDYYKVDKLISLANTKIKHLLQSNSEEKSWVVSLPTAIEEAVGSTGDDELLGILAAATAGNISTLLELDQFKSLGVMSSFSVKVLQNCAQEIRTLAGELQGSRLQLNEAKLSSSEIELQKEQVQQSRAEISQLRFSLQVLRKTNQCRNCDVEFQCFIDPDECLLRCAKCRCKHYS